MTPKPARRIVPLGAVLLRRTGHHSTDLKSPASPGSSEEVRLNKTPRQDPVHGGDPVQAGDSVHTGDPFNTDDCVHMSDPVDTSDPPRKNAPVNASNP